jgi:hypothetical protein
MTIPAATSELSRSPKPCRFVVALRMEAFCFERCFGVKEERGDSEYR